MDAMSTNELLVMIIPILILQLGLVIYALYDLSKRGVRNLSPLIWVVIILFINLFGAVAYFLLGRGNGRHDED